MRLLTRSVGIPATTLIVMLAACVTTAAETTVDYPVAFVNSETITKSQVDRRISQLMERAASASMSAPSFDQVLELEIGRNLIIQAAEKEFDIDLKDRIKKRAEELEQKRQDPKMFKHSPSDAQVHERYRDLLVQNYLQKKVDMTCAVTPAQLREYYEANRNLYTSGQSVTIREILVRQEGRTADEAAAICQKAAARIAAGEDFTAVAKEVSESSYASTGGLWPPQERGKLIPEVEKVAFSLKPGDISPVFKSALGWHVVRLEKADSGIVQPFAEVQQSIRERLMAVQRRNAEVRLIEGLRSKAIVRKAAS